MMIGLDIQNPEGFESIPCSDDCQTWVHAAIQESSLDDNTMVIRFVNEEEGIDLNHTYRGKDSATNVLSFPFETPEFEIPELLNEPNHLGDLVLCEQVVTKEAAEQDKTAHQHWAHLIVHGTLHLQGYDHINDDDANLMESLEINILNSLGFDNPYTSRPLAE